MLKTHMGMEIPITIVLRWLDDSPIWPNACMDVCMYVCIYVPFVFFPVLFVLKARVGVMWKLRVQNPDVEIVVEIRDGMRMYFSRAADGSAQVQEGTALHWDFDTQLSNPNVYYLVDRSQPLSSQETRQAHTLLVASPTEKKLYHDFEKENRVSMFYMTVWPYSELEAARRFIYTNVSAEKLRENYAMAGGSIRLCLDKPHHQGDSFNVRRLIDEAVAECNVEETLSTDGNRANRSSTDYLLHAIV